MMTRVAVVLLGLLLSSAVIPEAGITQDVSLRGHRALPPLPPAFLQRLKERPDFFRLKGGWIKKAEAVADQAVAVTGTLPLVVVMALFSDSQDPFVSSQEVQTALFDGPSPYGTVTEFYEEASGGRLTITGQVLPWVRTSLTLQQVVGDSYGLGDGAGTGTYLLEALAAVDPEVDFGQFDNDGPDGMPNSGDDDGQVDAVAFQFLEIAASCGGPGIWPHRARLQYWNGDLPFVTDDTQPSGNAIVLNDYIVQSAVDCGGDEVQKATTISHEMGHVLGLPDLYDRSQGLLPEERRWVVGCWSLMAAGSWGCGVTNRDEWLRPTHFGAWEKERLGWLSNVQVVGPVLDHQFTLEPVQASEHVLKVPLEPGADPSEAEYLLVEYRAKDGFDAGLPSEGVLVYHIDPKIPGNRPCDTCPQVYRVSLLEADGNNTLRLNFLQGGNRGEPGDAWGAFGAGRLTPSTYPSTRLHSGAMSPVTIYEISLGEGLARINLSSSAVPTSGLLQTFLNTASTPLSGEEIQYLDSRGNGNGQYDVGDLRAYLRR